MRFALFIVAAAFVFSCVSAYDKDEISFVCDMTKKYNISCPNCNEFCKGCGITCDAQSRITAIDWSYTKVSKVSSGISKCSRLEDLIIHDTPLKTFPTEALTLTNLRVLDLHNSNNAKFSIPTTITGAKKLHTLDLSNCGVSSIPPVLAQVTSLTILFVPLPLIFFLFSRF